MLSGQNQYYRLDLKSEKRISRGVTYTRRDVHHWGPDGIFAEDDLYTTHWGQITNTEIEQFFFGNLDKGGPTAIDFFQTSATKIKGSLKRRSKILSAT